MPEPEPTGLRAAAKSAIGSGLEYAKARSELLRLEADEACGKLRLVGNLAGLGTIFLTAGYVLLLIPGVEWLATSCFGGNRYLALGIVGGVHLFAGVILLLGARARSQRIRPFRASLDQLEIDRQWAQELQQNIKSKR